MAAQCLGALPSADWEHMYQLVSGNWKGHQGGKSRLQLVQPRRRPAVRWPPHADLSATAASAQKPVKRLHYRAEQRGNLMPPPVLQMASRPQDWHLGRSVA
jgi:hypothetical protein